MVREEAKVPTKQMQHSKSNLQKNGLLANLVFSASLPAEPGGKVFVSGQHHQPLIIKIKFNERNHFHLNISLPFPSDSAWCGPYCVKSLK